MYFNCIYKIIISYNTTIKIIEKKGRKCCLYILKKIIKPNVFCCSISVLTLNKKNKSYVVELNICNNCAIETKLIDGFKETDRKTDREQIDRKRDTESLKEELRS